MIFVRCGVKRERRPSGRHVLLAHALLTPCRTRACTDDSKWGVTSDERMGPSARDNYGSRLMARNLVASQIHRRLDGGELVHGQLSADLVFECSCVGDHEVGLDAATAVWAFDEAAKAGRQAIWLPAWLPLTVSA